MEQVFGGRWRGLPKVRTEQNRSRTRSSSGQWLKDLAMKTGKRSRDRWEVRAAQRAEGRARDREVRAARTARRAEQSDRLQRARGAFYTALEDLHDERMFMIQQTYSKMQDCKRAEVRYTL